MFLGNRVLVVAAHPDDELLGCGATLLKLQKSNVQIFLVYISEGVSARFEKGVSNLKLNDSIENRENMAKEYARKRNFTILDFFRYPNLRIDGTSFLDSVKQIQSVIEKINPDVVLTHFSGDLNRDHRFCFEVTFNAIRPFSQKTVKSLLSFEIPSSTEWNAPTEFPKYFPNYFVNVEDEIKDKIEDLDCYSYEMRNFPHPRSKEIVLAWSQIRGSQAGFRNAESFIVVRSIYS